MQEGRIATAAQCLAGQYLAGWVIENLAGIEQKDKALKSVALLDDIEVPM